MKQNFLSKLCALAFVAMAAIFGQVSAFAQTKTISGTVVDESGQSVIGASVIVVGNSSVGTITDMDGKYTLSVPVGATLSVSFIGSEEERRNRISGPGALR